MPPVCSLGLTSANKQKWEANHETSAAGRGVGVKKKITEVKENRNRHMTKAEVTAYFPLAVNLASYRGSKCWWRYPAVATTLPLVPTTRTHVDPCRTMGEGELGGGNHYEPVHLSPPLHHTPCTICGTQWALHPPAGRLELPQDEARADEPSTNLLYLLFIHSSMWLVQSRRYLTLSFHDTAKNPYLWMCCWGPERIISLWMSADLIRTGNIYFKSAIKTWREKKCYFIYNPSWESNNLTETTQTF